MKKKTTPAPAAKSPSKLDIAWLAVIAALAIGVRIIFALDSRADPFNGLLFLDAKVYHLLASEIANSNFWGSEVYFRAPLFPYVLGITYKLFGMGQFAIKLINGGFGVATAILTYLIAEFYFDRRVARAAGIIAAVYPTLYFFEASLMPTAVEVFTFTLSVYLLSRFEATKNVRFLAASGVALALAALARPTILAFAILLPYWLWISSKNRSWGLVGKKLLWVAIPMAVVILPVTIRNYAIESDPVLISSQGGANFYIGNNESADGQTVAFPTGQTPLDKYEDHIWSASKYLAEQDSHRKLSAAEVSDFWFERGMDFVKGHPGEAIGLFCRKVYLFFCGEELFNNSNPLMARDYSKVYAISLWRFGLNFPYGLLAPLFLLGAIFLIFKKNKRELLLLFVTSQVIAIAMFFVSSRFRQPVIPVMTVIAVFAAVEIYDWLRRRKWRGAIISIVVVAVLAVALNPPTVLASRQNRSMYHALLGGALASQERYPEAVEQLRESIVIADDNPTAFQLLGSLYVKSGQIEQALAVLHRAEELAPDALQTKSVLARIYYDRGEFVKAFQYFETVLSSGVKLERENFWAARSAYEIGNREAAERYLREALKENSADPEALKLSNQMNLPNTDK